MRRVRDQAKERRWRRLVERHKGSGASVARFCESVSVPVHQFYWWRRVLQARDRQGAQSNGKVDRQGNLQATLQPRQTRGGRDHGGSGAPPDFLPVRLPFVVQAPIEVVHPNGCVVRLATGFDEVSLRRVLMALGSESRSTTES